jgi:guanylate kinase
MKIERKGLMLILSSPSGAGKTTISKRLLDMEQGISMSVSTTTRPMRKGEIEGKDYYFVSHDKFQDMVKKGEFLEHAHVFGNNYGTPSKPVADKLSSGSDVLFDIDWQGTIQLKEKCKPDVVSIFILPPSMKELESRLRVRAQDDEKVIKERMDKASHEISHWGIYDYVLVNDDIDEAVTKVVHILRAERARKKRQTGLENFISKLVS